VPSTLKAKATQATVYRLYISTKEVQQLTHAITSQKMPLAEQLSLQTIKACLQIWKDDMTVSEFQNWALTWRSNDRSKELHVKVSHLLQQKGVE
jgi:hypothetical protein